MPRRTHRGLADGSVYAELVADLGGIERCAHRLAVHPSTVRAWLRRSRPVPHVAYLAMVHLSRWGRADRFAYSRESERQANGMIQCLREDLRRVEAELARLLRVSDFGCANAPLFRVVRA